MMNSDRAYDLFSKIANASGNTKQAILKGQDVKEYLLAAYDPFTKYHITKGMEGKGSIEFDELVEILLVKLSTRELTGHDAQNMVNLITREMTEKSSKLLHMILNKDLRMGIGIKTINKVFPGLIPRHPIMLAKSFDKNRAKYPCFGEPKYHGNRAVFDFKKQKFLSRSGHNIVGVEHLIKAMPPYGYDYDGELRIHEMTFQKSNGQINSNDLSPLAQYHIFAIYNSGHSYFEDRMILEDLDFAHPYPIIHVIPNKIICDYEEAIMFYNACVKVSSQYKYKMFDGCILKTIKHIYQDKRSYDWMKIKDEDDISLKVYDIYEGKGKYKGMLGGVFVWHGNVSVKVGGGFDDNDRKKYYENPKLILDKIIDVLYQEVTDDGSLRDPIFGGIRHDKEKADEPVSP